MPLVEKIDGIDQADVIDYHRDENSVSNRTEEVVIEDDDADGSQEKPLPLVNEEKPEPKE